MSRLRRIRRTFSLTAIVALLAGAISAVTTPPATAAVSTQTFQTYSAGSITSQYHIYANGIDWSRPVGAVFYFDGDYWQDSQSKIKNPAHSDLTQMAAVANQNNMVFVPVVSPDKDASGNGITWWENLDRNGAWFRSFAQTFISSAGINQSNVWTVGYSGGAEFITFELGARNQQAWRTGGGDLIIGGGGSNGMKTTPSSDYRQIPMYWYVGTHDGKGATWPATWSAYSAAYQGYSVYRAAGFTNTQVREQAGKNHYQYEFSSYLKTVLAENAASIQSAYTLRGAIGAYYYAHNGTAVFGAPTGNEFPSILGGYVQNFSNHRSIYWSPETGTHPVYWRGAIGARFKSLGYEFGIGYPTTTEISFWHGYKQHFRQGEQRTVIYWSESTGARTLNERGAIFARWAREGDVKKYGFPVTDEYHVANGVYTVKFSGGRSINWSAQNGTWVS